MTDESIDLARQLLGKKFPDFAGFSDIALTKQNEFDAINAANYLFKFSIQVPLSGYVLQI